MSKIRLLKKFGLFLTLFLLFNFVSAQDFPVHEPITDSGLFRGNIKDTLLTIFQYVFRILTWLAGAFAVGYIIWGGIQVIIQGKPDEGKTRLIYGVVGLIIALISYALVRFIENFVTTGTIGG